MTTSYSKHNTFSSGPSILKQVAWALCLVVVPALLYVAADYWFSAAWRARLQQIVSNSEMAALNACELDQAREQVNTNKVLLYQDLKSVKARCNDLNNSSISDEQLKRQQAFIKTLN